jgi:pimeloyl-ACP methyl ester carboxylesterase
METAFAEIEISGRKQRLEYAWIDAGRTGAPLVVFLHEGLGSVAMWRDYPRALCVAAGVRGLAFSRYGYGRSTPRPSPEKWPVDFMHAQARDVLPALFAEVGVDDAPWLFGHSDGGSIALLHAAMYPEGVAGLVVAAPHVFVEDVSVASIEQARDAYSATDLRQKLARYHDDPDSAFRGWNDVWLDPAFRAWNIENMLSLIRCPLLAVQGEDDEYGTMAQIDVIARCVPQARLLKLPACGHSPHRDQPRALTDAAAAFINENRQVATARAATSRVG